MIFDLIVPCYNPPVDWEKSFAYHLIKLRSDVAKTGFRRFQVILINDGSRKNFNTREIGHIQDTGVPVRVIANNRNYGKGYSLRKAIDLSTSPYCVYTDLDFPFGTESVVDTLINLKRGHDIVLGARSSPEYYRQATIGRRIMSRGLMMLNRYLFNLPFEDTQAGIKGFNQAGREIFLSTTINRFLFDLEFVKIACSYPDISIQSICVVNNKSLHLSAFGFRTILIELINLIRILVKYKYAPGTKKDLAWD